MKHLHKVASDIQKLRKMDFKCHCCVEAKMKHAPKPPISITVISAVGQLVSGHCRTIQSQSIQKSSYGLAFTEHYRNMPFLHGLKNKSNFPRFSRRFLLKFREQFKGCVVLKIHMLRSDNAQEFKSAEVLRVLEEENILPQYSNPREQFQNGKTEKCIGDSVEICDRHRKQKTL